MLYSTGLCNLTQGCCCNISFELESIFPENTSNDTFNFNVLTKTINSLIKLLSDPKEPANTILLIKLISLD
mgnify:CR=1 FL=1